jgi:hypothetical protein
VKEEDSEIPSENKNFTKEYFDDEDQGRFLTINVEEIKIESLKTNEDARKSINGR